MPETDSMREAYEAKAQPSGLTWEQFQGYLAGTTHPRRVLTLAEVVDMAVVMASDRASGMTGTTVNLTMAPWTASGRATARRRSLGVPRSRDPGLPRSRPQDLGPWS